MEKGPGEYEVLVHRKVDKFLSNIDEKNRARVLELLSDLRTYPQVLRHYDAAKLKGVEYAFRIRVGAFRIIFQVDKHKRRIIVTRIDFRERVYEA